MKSDAIAFGVAGCLFGLIAGWIIGSQQQARPPAAAVGDAAPPRRRRAGGGTQAPRCSTRRRSTRSKSVAEREPANAAPRVQLGNLYFDAERYDDAIKWYERGAEA